MFRTSLILPLVLACGLAVAASGCAPAPEPAYPPALPAATPPAAAGLDDDPPGELYKDDDIYDDDVGVLDYHIEPGPGL